LRFEPMIDFRTLRRPATPNTALYADADDTPSEADRPAPRIPAPPADVIVAWDRIVKDAPRTRVVLCEPERGIHHAVQRSRIFRFADDIYAEALAIDGGTRLLLYSAARLGRSDLGVNGKRLAEWSARLAQRLSGRVNPA
jgi:uncharacterized protein (DUF1499 family)